MKWRSILFGSLLAVFGVTSSAQAAAITGEFNIGGSVTVSATTIDWVPPIAGGFGNFVTTAPADGYFADIFNPLAPPNNFFGSALDLGPATVLPLAGYMFGFMEDPEVASEYDDLSFTLESIIPPDAALPVCVAQVSGSCRLGIFTLTVTPSGVEIGFGVAGFFIDLTFGDDGSLNTATGTYTTQLVGETIANIVGIIDNGGSISASYSGNFEAVAVPNGEVPEPGTLLMFGTGSALLALRKRRRANKA